MYARALLVFLVACACPLFFNEGRSSENSFQRVLIVLYSILLRKWMLRGSYNSSSGWKGAQTQDLPNPRCRACVHSGRPHEKPLVQVNGRICFGSCHAYIYGGSRVP